MFCHESIMFCQEDACKICNDLFHNDLMFGNGRS